MTALGAVWRYGGDPEIDCRLIVDAQAAYGPDGRSCLALDDVAFGRALYRTLPEDRLDRQPLTIGDGRFVLIADIRIDNREDLLRGLGLAIAGPGTLSDAQLLGHAFAQWGEAVIDKLVGDYAFAVFDRLERHFLLARDPVGQRPLHFFRGSGLIAIASMPRALAVLPEIKLEIDERRMAEFGAGLHLIGPQTFYRWIDRVEPGEVVRLTPGGADRRKYWDPPIGGLRLPRDEDYVAAFREQLDQAAKARLRGSDGLVATHLSAGWDSSAVAATAARLLAPAGGKVIAFTSAPREGFNGPVPRGRVADESPYAAATARLHPNIEHVVLRDPGRSAFSLLERNHDLYQYPVQQVDNDLWWSSINAAARARGAKVLLTGQHGNLTLNAAGLGLLTDLIRIGAWRRWLREARRVVRRGPARWTGVLANSFGPWLPPRLYDYIRAAFLGSSTLTNTPFLLNPNWAERISNTVKPGRDARPQRDSYKMRLQLLKLMDLGCYRKGSLAGYGIDERDPTADRRLMEFCFSLPPEKLLKDGVTRPLARTALSDRLPDLILNDAPRGLQGAGWYEILRRDEASERLEQLARCPLASSILNVPRLREMIERWPAGNWNDDWVVQEYRQSLAMALSIGSFIESTSIAEWSLPARPHVPVVQS